MLSPHSAPLLVLLLLWCPSLSLHAEGGKFNAVLKPGVNAPPLPDLPGIDGKTHNFKEFSQAKAIVLVFTRNHCPYSQKYEPRFRKIVHDFSSRGVTFIAVNSSKKTGEDLPAMRAHAEQNVWKFPYLKDKKQQLAKSYGATATPQFFVLGPPEKGLRKIAYYGSLDDHPQAEKVQEPYLQQALESLLTNKPIDVPESLTVGCELSLEE